MKLIFVLSITMLPIVTQAADFAETAAYINDKCGIWSLSSSRSESRGLRIEVERLNGDARITEVSESANGISYPKWEPYIVTDSILVSDIGDIELWENGEGVHLHCDTGNCVEVTIRGRYSDPHRKFGLKCKHPDRVINAINNLKDILGIENTDPFK